MPAPFNGRISVDVRDSTPDWTPYTPQRAPEGAPNVLIVLYDDTGLAAWEPYGGRIRMPTMQRLAENGLTYTQWHTTSLCSPTRSCMLTGRNHHQTGFACIVEGATGYPGSNAHLPRETATIAQALRGNGWNTYWVGKDHNVPPEEANPGGPKFNWPLQQGFDRFYGFLGGETNQWYPTLVEDNHAIEQPTLPEEGYHFSKDIADQALQMLRDSRQSAPSRPWFMWLCPGANHAPHHVDPSWADKYKGQFDDGYEAYREWVLGAHDREGHHARRHRADAAEPDARGHVQPRTTSCGRGTRCRTTRSGCSRAWPRCSPASASTPTTRSAGSSTTSSRRASSTTRSSSTAPTTAPRARAARTARSTRTSSSTAGRTTSRRT